MAKYGNKKTYIRYKGKTLTFDSVAESIRGVALLELEFKGVISELIMQPVFVLQEKFRHNGKAIRSIKYIADFQYIKDGERIVEDVKGKKTAGYEIKKKMFLSVFGGKFQEVKYSKREGFIIKKF